MNLLQCLRSSAIVAIVRGADADAAIRTVLTLFDEGIDVVEVSLVTADATRVIAAARSALGPGAMLGAGTVITVDDAAAAAEAGASFVVTPGLGPGIAEALDRGVPVLAGALTPTEIVEAMRRGADAIKLFPASLGGTAYLRSLRDPFPDVPFVPVGGIDADLARDYLVAGAIGVGVGSPLVGDAASGGSLESLRARARMFVRTLKLGVQP
jgi:2-dehydro-3-deoxyphosphogluconate aldolase/(4S)-4-hydroxy-2-oxoglutarate aldolase